MITLITQRFKWLILLTLLLLPLLTLNARINANTLDAHRALGAAPGELSRDVHHRAPSMGLPNENVELIGQIGGVSVAVAVEGNYAYVGIGPRLVILDISNPVNPTVVGQTSVLPDMVRDVAIAGNYAYVADFESGLRIINIKNPASPQEVGFFDTLGVARGVALAGDYAYVADSNRGLRVINIANPTSPTEVGFFDTPGFTEDVTVAGDYAYMADGSSLRVVNIANPASPRRLWGEGCRCRRNHAPIFDAKREIP